MACGFYVFRRILEHVRLQRKNKGFGVVVRSVSVLCVARRAAQYSVLHSLQLRDVRGAGDGSTGWTGGFEDWTRFIRAKECLLVLLPARPR